MYTYTHKHIHICTKTDQVFKHKISMERKEKNINTKIKQVRHHVSNLCREQKDLNSPPENIYNNKLYFGSYGWAIFISNFPHHNYNIHVDKY